VALNAGSAYSEYRLKYDGFLQDLRAVEREYARFAAAVDKGQPPTLAPDTRGAREAAQLAKLNASLAAQQARAAEAQARASATAAAGQVRLTVAQNAGAISAQRLATEQQRTAAATANAASAAARAQAAQIRLAQQQERASQSVRRSADGMAILPRTIAGLSDEAASFAKGMLGAGAALTAFSAASQTAVQSFQLKAAIDAGRVSLGAFLGSQEKANAAFQAGSRFADQYALRQSEVAAALSSLAPLLRTSTTETEKQLEVLARLQSLNPAATFQDAAFSIKELASGDYASIADQFNLGRAASQALRDEVASGVDVFVALDRVLAQNGATVDVLATRLEGATGAQNQYNASVERLQLAIGTLVTGPGTAFLNWLAQGAEDTTAFINLVSGITGDQLSAGLLTAGQSFEVYAAAAREAAIAQRELAAARDPLGALFGLYPQVQALTQAQYGLAQSLMAAGASADQAYARVQALEPVTVAYANALGLATKAGPEAAAAIAALEPALLSTAAASEANQAAVLELIQSYLDMGGEGVNLAAGLQQIAVGHALAEQRASEHADAEAASADEAAAAAASMDLATVAASAEADALRDATAAAFEQANAGAGVEAQARAAAEALLGAGDAGAAAAAKLANSSAQVDVLTAALYRQEAAALAARAALGGGGALSNLGRNVARGVGGTTEAIRALNRVYNAGPLGQPPPRSTGGGRGSGGGRASGGASAEAKAAEKRNADLTRLEEQRAQLAADTQKRLEDLERDHVGRLLAIQAEYARKQLEAENKLRVGSLRSRASFYDALTQSTPEIGKAAADNLSAAYEAAFAEAQTLAQQGKAALASEFLSLRQSQISEELDAQKAIAAAREKGDKAEVDRLQRIEQLYKQAREEELKQLLEGGDANVNAQAEALDTESAAYAEKQAEIAAASDEKALKLTANEQKILGAVQATNLAYAEQLRLQQQAAGIAGGPPLPQAQQVAQQQAATAAPPLPTTAAGGAVLVDYPALLAAMLTLGADVARLAGVTEGHSGLLDRLIAAQSETARALGRLGVRSG
jgi:hypothetical protein